MSSSEEGVYEPGLVDPGLPVSNPTQSFWLSEPHALANHRSTWPNYVVDVVIIGSGISGTSLAYHLSSKSTDLKIVVLDARALCSGATGRNGGHIKAMSYATWEDRKKTFGLQEAIRITAFEESHLNAMTEIIRKDQIDCDLVPTDGVDAYYDEKVFSGAVAALNNMRLYAPELADRYSIRADKTVLQQEMHLSTQCVGAIVVPAASVWPYKMIMGILDTLIRSDKLNVQAHTAVHKIDDCAASDSATVHTSRGVIRARKVVHATNGWMTHLLPELRAFISPVRGNVVHYAPIDGGSEEEEKGPSAFGLSSKHSFWLRYGIKDYDYLVRRRQGDIVVGRANKGRKTTGDDSQTDLLAMAHLRGIGDEIVSAPVHGPSSHIRHAWSGILAFTQDSMPFAGPLTVLPQRSHQWICGGYHAIGMVKAWRTGEMTALMLLGEDPREEYPKSMLFTVDRLEALRRSLDPIEKPVAKL